MNKIFKVVWSKTKHCYVVTSELAKTHTKSNQTKSEVDGQGKGGFLGTGVSSAEMALRASLCAAVLTGAAIGVADASQTIYTGATSGATNPRTGGADQSFSNIWTGIYFETGSSIEAKPSASSVNTNSAYDYSGQITVYGAGNIVTNSPTFDATLTLSPNTNDTNNVNNIVGTTLIGNQVKFSSNPFGFGGV